MNHIVKVLLCVDFYLVFVYAPMFAQTNIASTDDKTGLLTDQAAIAGHIRDKQTERDIEGAKVELLNVLPRRVTQTNANGYFQFDGIEIGRYKLLIQKEGYDDVIQPDIVVIGGQVSQQNIGIEQVIPDLGEENKPQKEKVLRTIKTTRDMPSNFMSALAARSFTIEDVLRYAGARFDPARMVTNYAGASGYDDSRNDMVIRGNSPALSSWMVEELPVDNPNHITTMGTTGGITPILNIYALGKADFIKGSFAAQYGNALGGLFDVHLREGSTERFSALAQIGTQRAEALIEAPLSKSNPEGGSFLVAGRFSIGQFLPKPFFITDPAHQDFNFKLDLGKRKWGRLSFFGLGGYSRDYVNHKTATIYEGIKYAMFAGDDYDHRNTTALVGLNYTYQLGRNSFWRTVLGVNYQQLAATWFSNDSISPTQTNNFPNYNIRETRINYIAHSYFQTRLRHNISFRAGFMSNVYQLNLIENYIFPYHFSDVNFKGTMWLGRVYAQARWAISNNLILNLGFTSQYLTQNKNVSAEPRLSLSWAFAPTHNIALGLSLQSQMQSSYIMFYLPTIDQDSAGNYIQWKDANKLPFMRSYQADIEYNWNIQENWRLKVQTYFQYKNNIPIELQPSAFSISNTGGTFYDSYYGQLTSKGIGYNVGAELTLEKFFSRGFYALFSASVFDSKCKGSDGVWRNTIFNNRFIANVLAGKEFRFGHLQRHTFFADIRFSMRGGRPYTPIDTAATFQASGQSPDWQEVFIDSLANTLFTPNFYQVDVRLGLRLTGGKRGKIAHTIRIDLFNAFNIKNIFTYRYSTLVDPFGMPKKGMVIPIYQRGFIPDITYTIQF